MESPIVVMMNIGNTLVPCMQMLRVVHAQGVIRLTTYFWPSVWGWKAVDLVSLVSNNDQRLNQNVLRNLFPDMR
jgi:hypothetical protein